MLGIMTLACEYTPSGEVDGSASVRVPLQAGVPCVRWKRGVSVAAVEQASLVWWSEGLSESGDGEGDGGQVHGRKATGWWRLAAYGSSGGLEESAQGGDLEERVERHVVICARASAGTVASVRGGWWARGLVP